eukprot:Skav210322  [mRNA]  locus=scaffold475:316162:316593:- [translate_table: standard]
MATMTVPPTECGHCGREGAEFRCSRCRSAHFCDPGCFRKAWQQHKATCESANVSHVKGWPSEVLPMGPMASLGDGCGVVVVVPFREQLPLQHRGEQLARFLPHMRRFLSSLGVPARVLVVEQSQDGRKFNRGQLLNVGCLGCA